MSSYNERRDQWRKGHGPSGSLQEHRFIAAQQRTRNRIARKLPLSKIEWAKKSHPTEKNWEVLTIDGVSGEVRVGDGSIYLKYLDPYMQRRWGDQLFPIRKHGLESTKRLKHCIVNSVAIKESFFRNLETARIEEAKRKESILQIQREKKVKRDAIDLAFSSLIQSSNGTVKVSNVRFIVSDNGYVTMKIEAHPHTLEEAQKWIDSLVAAGICTRYD